MPSQSQIWLPEVGYIPIYDARRTMVPIRIIAAEGQTIFPLLDIGYKPNTNSIFVYRGDPRRLQLKGEDLDYTEADPRTILINTPATAGEEFIFIVFTEVKLTSTVPYEIALRVPFGEGEVNELPTIAQRKNKILAFDEFGQPYTVIPDTGSSIELRLDLANAIDPTKGTAIIGYKGTTLYEHLEYIDQRLIDLPTEADPAGTAATLINQHNHDPAAHPELSEFITQEADRAEAAAELAVLSSNAVWVQLYSELISITDKPSGTPGVVTNDPNSSNNGYYVWDGSFWIYSDFQPAKQQYVDFVQARLDYIEEHGQSLVEVAEPGVITVFKDNTPAAKINPDTGELETRYPSSDPRIMLNVDSRLADPLEQLVNYTDIERRVVLIFDNQDNAQLWADFRSGQEGVYFQGQKLGSGSSTYEGIISGTLDEGQSNAVAQAGVDRAVVYGEYYPFPERILMLGSAANNIWLGSPGSSSASREIIPSDITGLSRLRSSIASTGTHGTSSAEGFIYAQLTKPNPFTNRAGYLIWNTCEGNQTIQNMLNDAPAGNFYFQNQITCIQRATELIEERGQSYSFDWLLMAQGEANTDEANLGALHNTLRQQLFEAAQPITSQLNETRMISWQMSSFRESSTKAGVKSILDFALSQPALWSTFLCGGPTYIFPFCPDFLHQKSIGQAMRGEYGNAIKFIYELTGSFLPLHATSGTVTGPNELTITLSEPAVHDTTWLVEEVANSGIQLVGGSITSFNVTGNQVIIGTNSDASLVTAVRFGLLGQNSGTRTSARIPRSNIRSVNSIGQFSSILGGQQMYKPMCHQEIEITV